MNFRVDRWSAVALRSSLVVLTTVSALLLSSCGGSGQSSQSKRFKPTRMIVFGDESSLLLPPSTPNGIDSRKYTNNGFGVGTTANQLDCDGNPLWVQSLADRYGLVFAECNPLAKTATVQMRAVAGGKVADVVTAVDAFLASSSPVPTDLITVMAGTNDIIEVYESVVAATRTQSEAVTEIQRRAVLLGNQINRMTNEDNTLGRVLYSTVPQVHLTPYGRSKSSPDQVLLKLLSDSFNDKMRSTVRINGRSLGFLNTSQQVANIVVSVDKKDGRTTIINDRDPVCTVAILSCDPSTLVSGGTVNNYLWADDIHFSYAEHYYMGVDAVDLVTSLPW